MEKGIKVKKVNSLYRGGFILLLGFVFLKLGGFLFKIISMSVLPVSAYGEVAIFFVLFNWFVLFATFNVTIGMSKFVAQKHENRELYYISSLAGSIILSLIVSLVLVLLTPWISAWLNLSTGVLYWTILSVPFAVIYNIGIFYFRGMYRMKDSAITDVITTIIKIAVLIGLLMAGFYYAPYMAIVFSFIAIDIYLLMKNKVAKKFKSAEIFTTFKLLVLYSFPIFLSEFLRMFSIGIDRLMLSGFFSTAQAGFYDVAVALCIGYVMIATSYSNALLPLASASQLDKRRRKSELGKSLLASSFFFLIYTVVLMLAGRPVINIVNPLYLGIFDFMPMLMIAYILVGFWMILSFYVNGIGYQRHAVYSGTVFAFLSLILNFYLIPKFQFMGAITALLVSCAVSLAVMALLIWKVEK